MAIDFSKLVELLGSEFVEGLKSAQREADNLKTKTTDASERTGQGFRSAATHIQSAVNALTQAGRQMGVLGASVSSITRGLAGPTGMVIAFGAVIKAVNDFSVSAQRLGNFSRDINVARTAIMGMQQAGQRMGYTSGEMATYIGNMSSAMNDLKDKTNLSSTAMYDAIKNRGEPAIKMLGEFRQNLKQMGEMKALEFLAQGLKDQTPEIQRAWAEALHIPVSLLMDMANEAKKNQKEFLPDPEIAKAWAEMWSRMTVSMSNWAGETFQGIAKVMVELDKPAKRMQEISEKKGIGGLVEESAKNVYERPIPYLQKLYKLFGGEITGVPGVPAQIDPLSLDKGAAPVVKPKVRSGFPAFGPGAQHLNEFEGSWSARARDLTPPEEKNTLRYLATTMAELWIEGFTRKTRPMGLAEAGVNFGAPMGLENIPYIIKGDKQHVIRDMLQTALGIRTPTFRGVGQTGSWEDRKMIEAGVESGVIKGMRTVMGEGGFSSDGRGGGFSFGGTPGARNFRYGGGGRGHTPSGGRGTGTVGPATGALKERIATAKAAMMDQFIKEGGDPAHAEAAANLMVGQALAESQLNPRQSHDNRTGYGIYGASANSGRWQGMNKWTRAHGYADDSLEGQAREMMHSGMSGKYGIRGILERATAGTAERDTPIITKRFENPAVVNYRGAQVRQAAAVAARAAQRASDTESENQRMDRAIKAGQTAIELGGADININVKAPRGTEVNGEGRGVFKKVKIERAPQSSHAGAAQQSYSPQSYE